LSGTISNFLLVGSVAALPVGMILAGLVLHLGAGEFWDYVFIERDPYLPGRCRRGRSGCRIGRLEFRVGMGNTSEQARCDHAHGDH
jgi:hypothetical protein